MYLKDPQKLKKIFFSQGGTALSAVRYLEKEKAAFEQSKAELALRQGYNFINSVSLLCQVFLGQELFYMYLGIPLEWYFGI